MQSITSSTQILVTSCLTDRCIGCTGLYTNEILPSTIVCICLCHKKQKALAEDEQPLSNAIGNESPFEERTPK